MGTNKAHLPFAVVLSTAVASCSASADAATQYSFDMRHHAQFGVATDSATAPEFITTPELDKLHEKAMAQPQARTSKDDGSLRVRLLNTKAKAAKAKECVESIMNGSPPDCWRETLELMQKLQIPLDGKPIDTTMAPTPGNLVLVRRALADYLKRIGEIETS
ncbi:hypothetical protein PPGU19_098300 (plasmid) [Paraburkholderia sp. PGU19]|uniref:hypothetical protein n=1 Tax=Paraburkholderia sp. PGU19 TaxID=2735434 RepID=UPI0015D980A2|nr:hypothetical protein [Paraburkholderia sp. PGU19]BCG05262.1 hypothetical protein PPGU19_098300 [Paraburkholderia sp. PGU19]